MCISAFRFAIFSSALAAIAFPATVLADPMPSAGSVRALIESKEYRTAIVDVNRLLDLKGDLAVPDRDELFMLRGEADLGLRQRDAAITSFSAAAKESSNAKEADLALATQTLIEKSPGLRYTPRHSTAASVEADVSDSAEETQQPIDIVPSESRHKAFVAIYADQSALATGTVKSASNATSLPPILTALKSLHRLQSLEMAANGSNQSTRKSVKALTSHAATLIGDALTTMSAQVQDISNRAHATVQMNGNGNGNGGGIGGPQRNAHRGLDSDSASTLKQIVWDCQRISGAITDLTALSDDAEITAITLRVKSVSDQANDLLNTNWQANNPNGGQNSGPGGPGGRR
jgi:hypothetical protein